MDMIKFKHKLRSRKNMINGERINYLREKNLIYTKRYCNNIRSKIYSHKQIML